MTSKKSKSKTKSKSWYAKKSIVQSAEQTEAFMAFMHNYIFMSDMVVESKTWLEKDGCNIFLIGENHNTSKHIYVMFKSLVNELKTRPDIPRIDLLLEVTQEDDVNVFNNREWYSEHMSQLNNVRFLFSKCSTTRNCEMDVHWMDPNQMNKNVSKKDLPCGTRGVKGTDRLPQWIYNLAKIPLKEAYRITSLEEIQSENDLVNIFTQHCVVLKEINRASRVNPRFTMDFAIPLFMELTHDFRNFSLVLRAYLSLRVVLDLYTVARIIKSKMKNVVVYAGVNHTKNITLILERLGFTTMT